MIKITKDLILSVRELLDRSLDAYEIAHRLHIDMDDVVTIIKLITDIST
jgi:orotate phosphoribosyltransferase-like protein